jgi:acyl dehydratase
LIAPTGLPHDAPLRPQREVALFHFEDFTVGRVFRFGPVAVSAEDIVAFAAEFDPMPFHLDAAAGEDSLLGGLAASGWHSCCLMMRMICDGFLLDSASMGSPGLEEVRWLKPVHPGDSLSLEATVTEARTSRSRPDMGLVKFEFVLANQRGERVTSMSNLVMFARRPLAAEAAR